MKKVMKIAALFLCAVMITCLMAGCDETTRMKEENYTENTKTQILDMYGLPECLISLSIPSSRKFMNSGIIPT